MVNSRISDVSYEICFARGGVLIIIATSCADYECRGRTSPIITQPCSLY